MLPVNNFLEFLKNAYLKCDKFMLFQLPEKVELLRADGTYTAEIQQMIFYRECLMN